VQHAPSSLRPQPHDGISRRDARLIGWLGYLAAIALPAVLWREPIALVATDFRFDVQYLVMGWTGYFLIAAGLLFLLPVVVSVGRHPEDRLYPRSRNAYVGWGVTLYLLGCAIATQVAQIAAGPGET
jgi:hypothetical protein